MCKLFSYSAEFTVWYSSISKREIVDIPRLFQTSREGIVPLWRYGHRGVKPILDKAVVVVDIRPIPFITKCRWKRMSWGSFKPLGRLPHSLLRAINRFAREFKFERPRIFVCAEGEMSSIKRLREREEIGAASKTPYHRTSRPATGLPMCHICLCSTRESYLDRLDSLIFRTVEDHTPSDFTTSNVGGFWRIQSKRESHDEVI